MAKQFPRVLYGLHFYPGVAEYSPPDADSYRVFVSEGAIRKMGPSFAGKPLYVRHVNEVDLRNIQRDADGYVMESFFNKSDGKHWTKFLVVSDEAHAAVQSGWKLSNCYLPTSLAPAGIHNGLSYDKEVVDGEYEHLALVDDPRYEESIIFTPEEFKKYNCVKELELERLANSKDETKGEGKMAFSLFKRTKVENSAELESTHVVLPLSKREISVANALTELDKIFNMQGYASDDHMVKLSDGEMPVSKLAKKYNDFVAKEKEAAEAAEKEKNDSDEKAEPELANDDDEKKEPELANKKKNSADEKPEAAKPEVEKKAPTEKKKENFEAILNAADSAAKDAGSVDLSFNQVARGKTRYGS